MNLCMLPLYTLHLIVNFNEQLFLPMLLLVALYNLDIVARYRDGCVILISDILKINLNKIIKKLINIHVSIKIC